MIEEQPPTAPASMFFISLEGDGDPVIVSSASSGTASADPSGTRSRLGSSPLSSSLPKRLHIEERLARRSQRPSLSSSPGEVHLRRTHQLHELQARLAQADRRKRETVAQVRRQQEREQRSAWARMRERDFVVQYRRERLRHVPRSRLLDADLRTDHLSTMAGLIGGTWLRGKIRPLVGALLATGILDISEGLQGGEDRGGGTEEDPGEEDSSNPLTRRTNQDPGIGYARMQEAMMDRRTIARATELMVRLVKCDPVAARLTRPTKAGRILLTALLLDGFGVHVMPEASAQEEMLLEHAALLAETLRSYLRAPVRITQMRLAEHWSVFCESFTSWQGISQTALVHSLQADYIELARLLASLQSEEAKAEWRPHVLRHQRRLRTALMRVAGQGVIQELEARLADLQITPSGGRARPGEGEAQSGEGEEEIEFHEAPPASEGDKQEAREALGISWDDGKLANVHIAHELIIDPHFDHAKLMAMHKAAAMGRGASGGHSWSRSREAALRSLPTPTTSEDFLRFILIIKGQLLEMVRGQGSLAHLLEGHLEEAFLRQQLAHGALPTRALLLLLVECMGKMCAPARDDQIKHLLEHLGGGTRAMTDAEEMDADAIVQVCQEMVRTILLMHEDLSNFALRTVRPRLAQLIVGYEREWLAQHVLCRDRPMPVAERLIRALAAIEGDSGAGERADCPHPLTTITTPPLQRTHWIIREGLATLLGFPTPGLPPEAIPSMPVEHELFILDHRRLGILRRRLLLLVKLSAIGLALRALGHPQWEGVLERMLLLSLPDGEERGGIVQGQDPEAEQPPDRQQQQQIINPHIPDRALEEATRGITKEGEEQAIRAAIQRISSSSSSPPVEGGEGGDPLEALLRRRIGALLRQLLQSDGESAWTSVQGTDLGSAGKPVSILMRHGIAECLCGPLNGALAEIQRVYHLHRMVLAPVYYKYLHPPARSQRPNTHPSCGEGKERGEGRK